MTLSAESGSAITTSFRACDGARIRFADTGADSDTTLLLLAPWPESVWAFRRILASTHAARPDRRRRAGRIRPLGPGKRPSRPWSNNEYLHALVPNSDLHALDAGHFAWEEAPDEYGRLIADWVGGGYLRAGTP